MLTWMLALAAAGSETQQPLLVLLSNPVSDVARVDTDLDFEYQLGPEDSGSRQTLTLHPTLPLRLSDKWNLVTDIRVPLISQEGVEEATSEQRGIGELVQTSYLVPAVRNGEDFTWGIGTAIRFGTAAEGLGTAAWGAGPAVALVQYDDRLVSGLAMSQIWGDGGSDVWTLQGFTTWIGAQHSVGLQLDVEYEGRSGTMTVPLKMEVSRLIGAGDMVFNVSAGARFYIDVPENLGPWGVKFSITCARRN
jgi:hypothetical protein